jgi:hypothetical protein
MNLQTIAILSATLLSSPFVRLAAAANLEENVDQYARACFAKLEIDPKDIPWVMDCHDGERIPVTLQGSNLEQETCSSENNRGDCDLPARCDIKDWLNGSCYGNSYLTTFRAPSNAKVTIALMCRHKTKNTNEAKRFDDIAMILHNRFNGETCWFQTVDGEGVEKNGKRVPRPTRLIARTFWLSPDATRGIECINCHDSGPFVISPWINQANNIANLRYAKKTPYRNSTPPFNKWKQPRFVSIDSAGLALGGDDKPCTHCHQIATTRTCTGLAGMAFDQSAGWISLASKVVANPLETTVQPRVFMPPRGMKVPIKGRYHVQDWVTHYKAHVDRLLACCLQFAKDPAYKGDSICHSDAPVASQAGGAN